MSNTAYASTSTAGTVVVAGAALVLGGGGALVDGAPVVLGAAVVEGAALVVGARTVDAGAGGGADVGATSRTEVAPGRPPSVAVVPAPRSELHAAATSAPAKSAVVSRRGDIAPKVPAR
jgi:hypothetical protein